MDLPDSPQLPNQSIRRQRLIGFAFVLVGAISFSTKSIFVKLTYGFQIDAIQSLTLRMAFALPIYLAILALTFRPRRLTGVGPRQWLGIIGLGILGYYLSSFFDFAGLQFISAGLERIILFVYPTLVVVIAAIVFRQKITARVGLALGLTYVGILIVFSADWSLFSSSGWVGVLLVFLSAVCYAIYLIGTGRLVQTMGSLVFTALAVSVSALAVFIHFSLSHDWRQLIGLPAPVYGYSLLMALVATVIPTILISEGIRRLGSGRASIISSVGPVITIVLAAIFLNEPISLPQLAGAALVIGGVVLTGK